MTDIVVRDRVLVTTTTTGTGTYTLSTSAETGYITPVAAGVPDGSLVSVTVLSAATGEFENILGVIGLGGTPTLTRAVVRGNHLGTTAPVNWGPGTKLVFVSLHAADVVLRDNAGDIGLDAKRIVNLGAPVAANDAASLRSVMAGQGIWCGTATYSGNTYSVTQSPSLGAYVAGQVVRFLLANTNGAASPSLSVDGLSAKTLIWPSITAIAQGALQANTLVEAMYDGTNFIIMNLDPGVLAHTVVSAPSFVIDFSIPQGLTSIALDAVLFGSVTPFDIGVRIGYNGGSDVVGSGYINTGMTLLTDTSLFGFSVSGVPSGYFASDMDAAASATINAKITKKPTDSFLTCNYQSQYLTTLSPGFHTTRAGSWTGSTGGPPIDFLRLYPTAGMFAPGSFATIRGTF